MKRFIETPILSMLFFLLIETYILLYFLDFSFTIGIARYMLDNFATIFLLLPRAEKMHLYFLTINREIATGAIVFCLFLLGIYIAIVSLLDIHRFKSYPIKFSKKNMITYGFGIILSITVSVSNLLFYDVHAEYMGIKEKDIPLHSIAMTKEIVVYFIFYILLRSSILGFFGLQKTNIND